MARKSPGLAANIRTVVKSGIRNKKVAKDIAEKRYSGGMGPLMMDEDTEAGTTRTTHAKGAYTPVKKTVAKGKKVSGKFYPNK